MAIKQKILLNYGLIGGFAGYFIFHPLVMVLSNLMHGGSLSFSGLLSVILMSFTISMLPWSLSFALFNVVIGLFYGSAKAAKLAREQLIVDLQKALADVKTLSGMLPICSSCKKIRNDEGYWQQIEVYIRDHSEADFTHGICNECVRKLYPEHYEKFKERMESNRKIYVE